MDLLCKKTIEDLLKNEFLIWMKSSSPPMSGLRKNNTYDHNLMVSERAFKLAKILRANKRTCARAGLLHDCWLEKFKKHPYSSKITHYKDSVEIAKKIGETEDVLMAIRAHMFPFGPMPLNKESLVVWLADKIISSRELFGFNRNRYLV